MAKKKLSQRSKSHQRRQSATSTLKVTAAPSAKKLTKLDKSNTNTNTNANANSSDHHKKKKSIRAAHLLAPDPRYILFDALRQRKSGGGGGGKRSHDHASFFVLAAALGLCARSTMENRLHFLYDLFHPHDGYGGVATATSMEFGGKLLSMDELMTMTFTTLRALSGIMHGHIDHVPTNMHDVRHAIIVLIKNLEQNSRGHHKFSHNDGLSWLDFERFVHNCVLPSAPWLVGVLDDAVFQEIEGRMTKTTKNGSASSQDSKSKTHSDPYSRRGTSSSTTEGKETTKAGGRKKEEWGSRATKFAASSKGVIEINIISLASSSGGTHTHEDRAEQMQDGSGGSGGSRSSGGGAGGTAFAAHLRPMMNQVVQQSSRRTKAKSLDGAGIVSWNSRVSFYDTGEGTEAAKFSWSYGIDLELRIGETVCGGCFVDLYALLDSGQFGMQVAVRSARKRDKVSWGGGIIGKIRLCGSHISREKIEAIESERMEERRRQAKKEKERERQEEEEEEAW